MHHRQNHWFDLSYYTVFPLLSLYGLVLFQCLGTHHSIVDRGGGGGRVSLLDFFFRAATRARYFLRGCWTCMIFFPVLNCSRFFAQMSGIFSVSY